MPHVVLNSHEKHENNGAHSAKVCCEISIENTHPASVRLQMWAPVTRASSHKSWKTPPSSAERLSILFASESTWYTSLIITKYTQYGLEYPP